jgi:2-hydroxycyclohexanecarboxyl-CoA dehydrogenase
MELNLAGKTVIVTGGGSHIGRGIAHAFAKEGSNVVIAELDEPQGKKVVAECDALGGGGRTILVKTDVASMEQVETMVKKTLEEFKVIDVVVNNVGWTFDRFFLEKPRSEWEREIAVNFWSVINTTKAILPLMVERKYGKFINIGSDAAKFGEPREAVYAGCKGAVISFTKGIAREYSYLGINVNCICPAVMPPKTEEEIGEGSLWNKEAIEFLKPREEKWTSQYAMRRWGTPEDIANMALFLASDCAKYITGQAISVNGGFYM